MASYRYDIAGHLFEADHVLSEQEAQQLLDQFQPQAAPAAAAPPAQGGGQPSIPGLGTPSDMLQVGVPIALRAAGMMRNPLALAATALASRALPALFTKPPAGETPRSEVGRQVKLGFPGEALGLGLQAAPSLGARALRAFRGPPPQSLPAITEMAQTQGGLAAGRMARPEAAREAGEVTQHVAGTFRDMFGTMFGTSHQNARRVRDGLERLRQAIPLNAQADTLEKVLNETGIDFRTLKTAKLRALMKSKPEDVAEAFRILGVAADKPVEQEVGVVAENLMSRIIDKAWKRPPAGVAFPQAFRGGTIDPDVFLRELGALDKRLGGNTGMGQVFGAEGTKALGELSRKLGGKRVAAEFARAGAGQVTKATPLRLYPFFLATSLFFAGRRLGGALGRATELGGEIFGAEEFARRVLPKLASTPAGLRWIAAGADLAARGVPDSIAVPALARMLPNVVRSLQGPQTPTVPAMGGRPMVPSAGAGGMAP